MNKYTSSISKGCVFEVYLEYPKELRELQNDNPLAADKIEIKKVCASLWKLETFPKTMTKARKNILCIRIQSITMVKIKYWIQHTKKNRIRKKWRQGWKSVVQINEQCCIRQKDGKLEK